MNTFEEIKFKIGYLSDEELKAIKEDIDTRIAFNEQLDEQVNNMPWWYIFFSTSFWMNSTIILTILFAYLNERGGN